MKREALEDRGSTETRRDTLQLEPRTAQRRGNLLARARTLTFCIPKMADEKNVVNLGVTWNKANNAERSLAT